MVKMRRKDKCSAQWIMKENCLTKVYKQKQKKEEKKLFCVTAKCGIVLTKRKGSSRDRIL